MIQGRSAGAGPYAFGALALALSIGILLYLKCGGPETERPDLALAPPTATRTVQLPVASPPPPPPLEEEDAGSDAGDEDAGQKVVGSRPPKGPGVCSGCGKGVPSNALKSAVASTAGLARGCYQRALRTGGAEGSIMVSVSVGADGSLCNSSIGSDTLNNATVSQCVLGKFRSKSYPRPEQGCVVVRVPINFKMKTP